MTKREIDDLEKNYLKYAYTSYGARILSLIAYTRELESKLELNTKKRKQNQK